MGADLTNLSSGGSISMYIDMSMPCLAFCLADNGVESMDTDATEGILTYVSNMLRVMADKKRLSILNLLICQERCVCEIVEELGLSQSLVSHHLGVLKQAGLVQDRRDAQWIYYSINLDRLAELNAHYLALFDVANLSPEAVYGASPRRC